MSMRSTFIDANGRESEFDLDEVRIICRGNSRLRKGWSATLVYAPNLRKIIELRSSDEDIRGFCREEAEEVSEEYAMANFGLDLKAIAKLRKQR